MELLKLHDILLGTHAISHSFIKYDSHRSYCKQLKRQCHFRRVTDDDYETYVGSKQYMVTLWQGARFLYTSRHPLF